MRQFTQALDRIGENLGNMTRRIQTIRQLDEGGKHQACQIQLLRLEESSERLTLLTRALPCYTGARSAPEDVAKIIKDVVPVEIGFTEEGWFCLRIPMLLPKKEAGSVSYLRGILYPATRRFFSGKKTVRYSDGVMIFRHVYNRECPERRMRDHDNIEVNFVADTAALYTLPDDSPKYCSHFYCSASADRERTEVYVVPRAEFSVWLSKEASIPDAGVFLYENPPITAEKHM